MPALFDSSKGTEPKPRLYENIDIRQVQLSFHDPEHIARMLVEEGDRVHKGQLLAVQDLARFQYAVDMADCRVDAQRQVLSELVAGSRIEDIEKVRADVRTAEADVLFTQKAYRRKLELSRKKFISVEEAGPCVRATGRGAGQTKGP